MSVLKGIFAGLLTGVYFAEKDLPFPLKYNRREDRRAGTLALDLQVVDTIVADLRGMVGYGSSEPKVTTTPS